MDRRKSMRQRPTARSLVWMDELKDLAGPRPPTDKELSFARSITVGGLATRLETIDAIANRLALAARDRLPADYFKEYIAA